MKKFVISYSDPKGILDSQSIDLYASSFPAAVVKALDYEPHFLGLKLTSITLVEGGTTDIGG